MKMFVKPKEQPEKSWSIVLTSSSFDSITLDVVDSDTGKYIGTILKFANTGGVYFFEGLYDCLQSEGYDPFEHKNEFDDDGTMVITKVK